MSDGKAAQEYDWMPEARELAAQCWCDEETKRKPMDPELAEACARRIAAWMQTGAQHARNESYWHDVAKKSSVCELGVMNPSVTEYMKHWEERTEKAEAAALAARDKQAEPVAWREKELGYVIEECKRIRVLGLNEMRDSLADMGAWAANRLTAAPPDVVPRDLHDRLIREVYFERNQLVAVLAKLFPSGVARTVIDGWDPEWHGCVYIDLPTGQVSWHFHDKEGYLFAGLSPYQGKWDGHDTNEKYRRLSTLTVASLIREARRDAFLEAVRIVEHEAFPSELPRFRVATDVLRDRADELDKEQK